MPLAATLTVRRTRSGFCTRTVTGCPPAFSLGGAARRPQAVVTGADLTEPVDRPGRGFKSGGAFFADVAHQAMGRGTSDALKAWDAYTKAATGLNETFGSDGGFLVPPEMAAGIYSIQHEQANFAARCRTIPINNNLTIKSAGS